MIESFSESFWSVLLILSGIWFAENDVKSNTATLDYTRGVRECEYVCMYVWWHTIASRTNSCNDKSLGGVVTCGQ